MPAYTKSNQLCIGGLEFRFSDPISWPDSGVLVRYKSFLERPARPAREADIIDVTLTRGLSCLGGERSGVVESGDGIRWSLASGLHIVEKILPHISSEPLWRLGIHLEDRAAELCFSERYLETEEQDGGWPVAAARYPMDQHLVVHFLAQRQGALIHSAGITCGKKGVMCSGPSGAGKTTISRLLAEQEPFEILTDDRVVLRCAADGGVMMHGTPWSGEGRYATSGSAPLEAVFFLKKDTECRARKLSNADIVSRVLPVTSLPWFNERLMTETMKTLETVLENTQVYDLHFTKSPEIAAVIADVLADERLR